MTLPDTEILTALVGRVFHVEGITLGDQQRVLVRYHGHLLVEDSAMAYDQLAEALRPYGITPLFRVDQGQQVVVLVPSPATPRRLNIWVNVILFALTFLSVWLTGALDAQAEALRQIYGNDIPQGVLFREALLHPWGGLPFTLTLMGILLGHELGHYFATRLHRGDATLPYFLPLPLISPLGTMGAVILTRRPPKNKRVLLDIGLAGPLTGFLLALPLLFYGLAHSPVKTLEDTLYTRQADSLPNCPTSALPGETYSCPNDDLLEGNSLLYLAAKYLVKGEWLPAPPQYAQSPWRYWLRYWLTGHPVPLGGRDVYLHPIAWAAWAGLLVTFLNLIPVGQLDGGHILYALLGRKSAVFWRLILVALLLLGFLWSGWWLWAIIIFFFGQAQAEPLDQITPLDGRRRVLAVTALILFLLLLTPVPLLTF